MKKFAVVLFGLALGSLTAANAEASSSCGTFEVAKGDIKVQSAGKVVPVSTGGKICSGDTVISGPDSRAKIKMADGNELNVSPDSKIVIEDYQYDQADNKKKVLLNILKGKVRATTREENMYNDKAKDGQANTFQIRTKSAVAGVRGTDFVTSYSPSTNKTSVVTLKGTVQFGQPGKNGAIVNSVTVTAGLSTTMTGGQKPETPRQVPSSELKTISTETKADSGPAPAGTPGPSSGGDKKDEAKTDEAKTEPKQADAKKEDGKKDGGGQSGSGGAAAGAAPGDASTGSGPDSGGTKKEGQGGQASGSGPGSQPGAGGAAGPGGGSAEPTKREPASSTSPGSAMGGGGPMVAPQPPAPPPMPATALIRPPVFVVPTPPPAATNNMKSKVNISINIKN